MNILIVDDSIFSQKVTANLMKRQLDSIDIFFANDGEEGFKKYQEIKPDYVIVDLLMPKLNGGELINLINSFDHNAKIIVMSADVQNSVKEEIEALGIIKFINKPFNQEKAELICNIIRNEHNE